VHRIASRDLPGKSAGFAQLAMMTVLIAVATAGASSGLEITAFSPVVTSDMASMTGRYTFAESFNSGRDHWMDQLEPYKRIRLGKERNTLNNVRQDQALPNSQIEHSSDIRLVAKNVAEKQKEPAVKFPVVENDSTPLLPETDMSSLQLAGLDLNLYTQPGAPLDQVTSDLTGKETDQQQISVKPRKKATVKPIKTVSPKYPSYARSRAVEGWVKLSFTVDKRGRAKDITVVDASPVQVFDRAAEKALRKWKFEILPGHSVDKSLVQTFDFAMHPSDVRPISRNRRCNTTGSNICGMFYRQETVENYGPQSVRMEASNKQ
jgi:protein TonB